MLLIQEISLTWYKEDRGSKGAETRARFPMAYPLEASLPIGEAVVQRLTFYQRGTQWMDAIQNTVQNLEKYLPQMGFTPRQAQEEIVGMVQYIKKIRLQAYHTIQDLNLTNLSICARETGYEISFFYDERRSGQPRRSGHNKDYCNQQSPFCGRDLLNEVAFTLAPEQYGRILWNERNTDYDTGKWYYQLHIVNLFHTLAAKPAQNLFLAQAPDFTYRQLAELL